VTALYWTVTVVALQRLCELAYARHNTVKLRRLGATEADAAGYPFFVLLHASWLASLTLLVPATALPYWPVLGFFALLQVGRVWVILSLGSHWTTRLVTLPDAPLVQTGPYRYFRHPNYLLVIAEVAVLPLAFGAVAIAATFSALNLVLIARRVRIEDGVLAPRRAL
jgi:methyltransferase